MTALFWLGVSLVGALAYATGAVAYWHAHDKESTPRRGVELALAWFMSMGAWIAYATVTTNTNGAQEIVSMIVTIAERLRETKALDDQHRLAQSVDWELRGLRSGVVPSC